MQATTRQGRVSSSLLRTATVAKTSPATAATLYGNGKARVGIQVIKMVPRLFFIYTLVTLLFPIGLRPSAELMIRCIEECIIMMENLYCMYRCIEECIRWKISTACTCALKSDVNMYLLCKNSSILNNSTTYSAHA